MNSESCSKDEFKKVKLLRFAVEVGQGRGERNWQLEKSANVIFETDRIANARYFLKE